MERLEILAYILFGLRWALPLIISRACKSLTPMEDDVMLRRPLVECSRIFAHDLSTYIPTWRGVKTRRFRRALDRLLV